MNFLLVLNNLSGTFIPFLNRTSAAAAFHFISCLVHLSERWLYSLKSVLILFYSLSLAMKPVLLNSFPWIAHLFSQNFRLQSLFLVPCASLSHNASNTTSRGSNQQVEDFGVYCSNHKYLKKRKILGNEKVNKTSHLQVTFSPFLFDIINTVELRNNL